MDKRPLCDGYGPDLTLALKTPGHSLLLHVREKTVRRSEWISVEVMVAGKTKGFLQQI